MIMKTITPQKKTIKNLPKEKIGINQRLTEGLKDIKAGRVVGPFKNAKDAIIALGI
jgi:hypothetical protein